MAHTPGPWEVSMDGFTVNSSAAFYIADCEAVACRSDYSGTDHATPSHGRANACLIAAAPDMLTALETVLAGGHLNTGEQAIVANAIAKALGISIDEVLKYGV